MIPTPDQHLELHLPIGDEDLTAVDVLQTHTPLSRQQLKQVMQKGAVWLTPGDQRRQLQSPRPHSRHTQRLRRAKKKLQPGDTLHLYYDAAILASQPQAAQLIAERGSYSVWYKPPGMFSQGSRWGDHGSIGRWAQQHLQPERPVFLVHRLDRATRGLMLLAHSKSTASQLAAAFEQRKVRKQYQAIVSGNFAEDTVTCSDPIDGRSACSHFQQLYYNAPLQQSLINVEIETGRKHQIRRHLASLGHPIIGDRLHGSADSDDVNLQLCAWKLQFPCPDTQTPQTFALPGERQLTL